MISILSRLLVAGLALGLAAFPAAAQTDYPRRPITLIVPFAAGGPTDVISRIVGEHMSRTLGQPIMIENIVGAGGTIASTRAARAATRRLHHRSWAIWAPMPPRSRSTRTWPTSRTWTSRRSGWWPGRRS